MTDIYFAAPLHDEADRKRNAAVIQSLRDAGYSVYAPQEHGVWEDFLEKFKSVEKTRKYFYNLDIIAMNRCNVCFCYHSREKNPSEGQLWEMGYMKGQGKVVVLVNETPHGFNLMPEFGADLYFETPEAAIEIMREQGF